MEESDGWTLFDLKSYLPDWTKSTSLSEVAIQSPKAISYCSSTPMIGMGGSGYDIRIIVNVL